MERFLVQWLIERLFALVEAIMPDERTQWARAMRAEANHVESGMAALSFAGGCLRAAIVEQIRLGLHQNAAMLCAGLVAGFMFFVHAVVPGSGGWPLLWPLLGGAMAALLFAGSHSRLGVGSGTWLGLRTGLVASLLFTVGGAILVSASESVTLAARIHILASGALLGISLSAIGAGAVTLLSRFR